MRVTLQHPGIWSISSNFENSGGMQMVRKFLNKRHHFSYDSLRQQKMLFQSPANFRKFKTDFWGQILKVPMKPFQSVCVFFFRANGQRQDTLDTLKLGHSVRKNYCVWPGAKKFLNTISKQLSSTPQAPSCFHTPPPTPSPLPQVLCCGPLNY